MQVHYYLVFFSNLCYLLIALMSLIHRWSKTEDKEGGCVRSLITDYRKAFDLIDHDILFAKLQDIGLKPSTLREAVRKNQTKFKISGKH